MKKISFSNKLLLIVTAFALILSLTTTFAWFSSRFITDPFSFTTAKLASITIGSLDLSPAFDPDTTIYSAETENATNNVSATGQSGVTATILVNGEAHTSGQSATWENGVNTVTVIASKTGATSTAYTVTVTKDGQG